MKSILQSPDSVDDSFVSADSSETDVRESAFSSISSGTTVETSFADTIAFDEIDQTMLREHFISRFASDFEEQESKDQFEEIPEVCPEDYFEVETQSVAASKSWETAETVLNRFKQRLSQIELNPPVEEEHIDYDKRISVLTEFIETEKKYIVRLDQLVKLYVWPLKARAALKSVKKILEKVEVNIAFVNIEVIWEMHVCFLDELLQAFYVKKNDIESIVHILGRFVKEFDQQYGTFFVGFRQSDFLVRSRLVSNPEFNEHEKICTQITNVPLISLLIEPIQRCRPQSFSL
jgi:hypothetical protein